MIESFGIQSPSIVIQDAGWRGGQHRMPKPYSNDLREGVTASVLNGRSCRETASPVSVWRVLWGLASASKNAFASEQDKPAIARQRAQWKKYQGRIDPRRLVFVDETCAKTNMAPLRGWGSRGRRLVAKAPQGKWGTLTFLAALRHDRMTRPASSMAQLRLKFCRLGRAGPRPRSPARGVVVMDNLGSTRPLHSLRDWSCWRQTPKLFYLPPLQPDPRVKPEGRLSTDRAGLRQSSST